MKIGILGSGNVAQALAEGFIKHGHEVMLGSRDASKLKEWQGKNAKAKLGKFDEAAKFGELLVLAVKGDAAIAAMQQAGAGANGKAVIDATNPIANAPPTNGVLSYFTGPNDSNLERLQKEFAGVKFVKAFNSVGAAYMVNPPFKEKPTMFIAGNDDGAKKQVIGILDQFGWETADMGKAEAARPIEALCVLWCIPGIAKGDWSPHAFKLIK